MFVSKNRFDALEKRYLKLEKACGSIDLDVRYAISQIRLHRLGLSDTMKALLRLNKKTQNLTEIVKLLPTNKERKIVIAIAKDGTKMTIGDVLDAEDLIPKVEEEYQSAII